MINSIIHGDCLQVMKTMESEYIDLTITSPPYDNLRTYNGFSFDFEGIAQELYRITKQGGVVVWVIGDETKKFCESLTSFKQAIFLTEICGFNLLDTMVYKKANYAPAYPGLRRYANQFEYMFVFSKGRPNVFNPVQREKKQIKNGYSTYRQKDGSLKKKLIESNKSTKDASNVWEYATGHGLSTTDKLAHQHPAIFPEKLAEDHILSWSNTGDIVLDPFCGSGTTCKMASLNKRNFIGIEISDEYVQIAKQRAGDKSA